MIASRIPLVGASAVLLATAIMAVTLRTDDELGSALEILRNEDTFTRASAAGAALNRVSIHLQDAGERCEGEGCDKYFTAAAMARVSAVSALRCTRPDLFELRVEFERYVDSLDADVLVGPPALPSC